MKLWNLLCCLVLMAAVGMGNSYGATLEKETITLMDAVSKKSATYKICNTLVNGKELETDVPGYIVESGGKQTVYVPVSTIYRSLNASVSWVEKTKKLTVKQAANTYVFEVDKTYVVVNGKNVNIDDKMPTKLMKYAGVDRTMVPASFIGKSMGMELTYQPEIRTVNLSQPLAKVNGFSYDATKKYREIRVQTTGEISTTNYTIDGTAYGGKSKIILEFQNSLLAQNAMTALNVNDSEVGRIELVNPLKTPPRVRLEIETSSLKGYYTYYDKAKKEQVIQIVNTLKDIQYGKIGDYHVVTLKTGVEPEVVVKKLQGKLVLDLLNTRLAYNNGSGGEKSVLSSGLINVAYSQFDPKLEYGANDLVSRAVLNFSDLNQQEIAFIKKNKDSVEIYLEGDPDKGVRYSKLTSASSKLEFKFAQATKVEKNLNSSTGELEMKIPKSSIALESVYRDYDDNLVEYLDVNMTADPDNYMVKVKLSPGTVVYDYSDENMVSVAFINEAIKNSDNKKTLIVLDAGHGGSDPGTIGKFTGVKEKDLALTAVNALKDELEKNGFEVLLTRTNDTRVELLQRTDLANEVNADLFISIHYNAAEATSANGIEVLYYPDEQGVKQEFAKTLFTELIRETGATARGVVKRPLLVVPRETKMPSALIEMGFVSNRDEEIKVQNKDYLSVQVKAIAQAVMIYLSNH